MFDSNVNNFGYKEFAKRATLAAPGMRAALMAYMLVLHHVKCYGTDRTGRGMTPGLRGSRQMYTRARHSQRAGPDRSSFRSERMDDRLNVPHPYDERDLRKIVSWIAFESAEDRRRASGRWLKRAENVLKLYLPSSRRK